MIRKLLRHRYAAVLPILVLFLATVFSMFLTGTLYVMSVDERFGADIVTTRNTLVDQHGELVMESFTTLMGHEGDNSISAGWDPETGQVTRKPVAHGEGDDDLTPVEVNGHDSVRATD